ncbi:hypothetical protein JW756_03710 [Candidatus Woesearchaeota archaeon]|nr:hypothetical protein [Candidatus Woesearchaeota archaeon]
MAVDDEEYELLPRQEIDNLKRELERLKKHPLGDMKEGETLLEAINNLNTNIRKLIDIFTKAEADLVKDYEENNPAETLKTVKEQNEQIAQGLVAVADLIKEMQGPRNPSMPQRSPVEQMNFDVAMQQSQMQPSQPSYPAPYPGTQNFNPDFGGQIPPPPQPFLGLESHQPYEAPMPEKKHKGLFGKR